MAISKDLFLILTVQSDIEEMLKNKDKIAKLCNLSSDDVYIALNESLRALRIRETKIRENEIISKMKQPNSAK